MAVNTLRRQALQVARRAWRLLAVGAGLRVGLLPALRDLDRPEDLDAALAAGDLAACPSTLRVVRTLLGLPTRTSYVSV